MLCALSTKIDYDQSNLPIGDGYLDVLVKNPAWKRALEEEIFQYRCVRNNQYDSERKWKTTFHLDTISGKQKSIPERGGLAQ